MPFQLSPGVLVVEKDLTAIIPAVATSAGAFSGAFQWGPIDDVLTVESEIRLNKLYGRPNDTVAQYWFTAANFLSYGNNLQVCRAANVNAALNATANSGFSATGVTIVTGGTVTTAATALNGNANLTVVFSAPDVLIGNVNIQGYATVDVPNATVDSVVITEFGRGYKNQPTVSVLEDGVAIGTFDAVVDGTDGALLIKNDADYDGNHSNGNGYSFGMWAAKWAGTLGNSIRVSYCDSTTWANWAYKAEFDGPPGTSDYATQFNASNDELHVIVIDQLGAWTGERGSILEKFAFVSKSSDARRNDGSTSYYKEVINNSSEYIWWLDHDEFAMTPDANVSVWGITALAAGTANLPYANTDANTSVNLSGGVSGDNPTDADIIRGFDLFSNDEAYDISLIPTGPVSTTVAAHVIDIASARKDCIAFVSPLITDVVNTTNQADKIVTTRNSLTSSSYAVFDSGWKYQYDKYNDVYRWIPMNGDIAGLCARTDYTDDPWFSPAGYNRGVIRNVVKLSYSPSKTDRDTLYKNGVNPVVTFPGQGTVLFGDKTMLAKPSAFDRINVRRLFIVLEKAIATASKFQLFEFNDAFTRAQFRTLVEPFLRDVQGRRGITDFRVICDETNNTGEVIDRNEFIADIFIKPARSINFIQLNFIATRTGVSFEEVGA